MKIFSFISEKVQILGRAKEIGDFVKNGRDKGYVEIDIMNRNGKVTTVRRDIKRDNKSDWKLDGFYPFHFIF